jgi:PAS domain S-box-containing protein
MLSAEPTGDNGWAGGLERFFPGGSEMARAMRAFDWSQTELGDPQGWPVNLQMAVRLCLTSASPISLWWGPRYLLLYNDAYLPRLGGGKKRGALMQPAREVWSEVWDVIGPMLDRVVATGTAVLADCQELFYDRAVPLEEVYISSSFGPVMGADGRSVDGVFCPCAEHTEKVIGARRLETLRQLWALSTNKHDVDQACRAAAAVLRQNPRDIPFAAIYEVAPGGESARCSATVVSGGTPRLPDAVSLRATEPASPWPLAQVLHARREVSCTGLEAMGVRITGPEWAEPVRDAIVLPLPGAGDQLVGLLVIGWSPRRPLDAAYRTFVDLVAGQVARALSDARAHEAERQRAEAAARAIEREQQLRKSAEDTATRTREKLALDLDAITELHDSSIRSLDGTDLDTVLRRVLDAIIALLRADLGMVQLYDRETRSLRIVAARGFSQESCERFENVADDAGTACGRALRAGARVIIEDVLRDEGFPAPETAGFRAVQSTPLFGRRGQMLGVISTQFLQPHRPTEHELRLMDLYARQASEVIERGLAHAELLALKDKLADDLNAMTLLHDLATRLLSNAGLEQRLEDVLDTTITLAGADFGHVQLYDEASGSLKIVAQRGFEREYLQYVDSVQQSMGIANALGRVERFTFEDVLAGPAFQAHLSAAGPLGYRALHATPLRGSCGQLLGVITAHFREPHRPSDRTLRFISLCARHAEELIERQRAEQALHASNERFRRYFDLGLIGMIILSPGKEALEVNDELCRILGYERHDIVGKCCTELMHPEDVVADDLQLARVSTGEIDGYSLDQRWIRRDGSVIEVTVALQCVRRSDRSVDYFVGLVQDVTARKTAEAALLEARADLARITRVTTMGELAASIAHEVNQPLTAIIANANACARWLAASPPNPSEANASMDRLVRDAKRAAAVLAGIRAFLKRQPPQRTKFDLNDLIVEVMAMLQGPLRAHRVSSSLAPLQGPALVTGDRVQLQQVMLNLIMNSIEAMAPVSGARRLQVDVDAASRDELRVSVRDSGVGLPFEHRSRIFDAFHTTKPEGMGMGLAISRSIVEAHGGRLWLAPKQGVGETFQFTLPAGS